MILSNPPEAFVIEVAVSHVQNLRSHEWLKRVKYERNSVAHIDAKNLDEVPRSHNLVAELQKAHRCPVKLGVLVIRAYGELVSTPEMRGLQGMLEDLGIRPWQVKTLLQRCCHSVAASTADIILRRLNQGRPVNA